MKKGEKFHYDENSCKINEVISNLIFKPYLELLSKQER